MDGHLWSKASKVFSLYTGELQEEDATGRFHASIAMTRQAFDECGGWPLTMRGDFDQHLLARLTATGPSGDRCSVEGSGYIFRWGSTGAYHGQAAMLGPEDEAWYRRVERHTQMTERLTLQPKLDVESRHLFPTFHSEETFLNN